MYCHRRIFLLKVIVAFVASTWHHGNHVQVILRMSCMMMTLDSTPLSLYSICYSDNISYWSSSYFIPDVRTYCNIPPSFFVVLYIESGSICKLVGDCMFDSTQIVLDLCSLLVWLEIILSLGSICRSLSKVCLAIHSWIDPEFWFGFWWLLCVSLGDRWGRNYRGHRDLLWGRFRCLLWC